MAKWGEGDPRWIVEERPDATNVNNWHWTEKNATPWSRDRFNQLFKNFAIDHDNIKCIIDGIEKCSGEATVNNRKGKLIFFYEWELSLKWSGYFLNSSNTVHNGKISIPNLSEENELNDIEITITIDESNDESETLKQFLYNFGREKIRNLLAVYIKQLKEEYSQNLILPMKSHDISTKLNCKNDKKVEPHGSKEYTNKTSNLYIGCKLDVRTLSFEEEFQCSANDLYNVLTKSSMVSSFTRAPAKVEANRGGQFHLYGGNVLGIFDDLVPEKRIALRWRLKSWPSGHYSNVLIEIDEMGINLANIIKDLDINANSGKPILNESIENLKLYSDEKSTDKDELLSLLKTIDEQSQKSIAHRVLAAKLHANSHLLQILEQQLATADSTDNTDVIESTLNTLITLYNNQPDIFDETALALAKRHLNVFPTNERVICLTLQWLQIFCKMHEINRQKIINAPIIQHLKPFVTKENNKVFRDVIALCRYLVLDDDIRVEFGCAHEHARQLAAEFIVDLTNLLAEFEDPNILAELLLTIGTLAVRQEFCSTVDEAGGIKLVLQAMANNANSVRPNREALKLLRALAGHDAVKNHIVQQGVAPILNALLYTHMANENLVTAALACISTLTLRVKDNSKALFDTGISEHIVESMRLHPKNKILQRNGAWAIRNMVSRSREQCDTWLSFGVEDVLNALRDLGCKVDLKEEWTGTAEKKIGLNMN